MKSFKLLRKNSIKSKLQCEKSWKLCQTITKTVVDVDRNGFLNENVINCQKTSLKNLSSLSKEKCSQSLEVLLSQPIFFIKLSRFDPAPLCLHSDVEDFSLLNENNEMSQGKRRVFLKHLNGLKLKSLRSKSFRLYLHLTVLKSSNENTNDYLIVLHNPGKKCVVKAVGADKMYILNNHVIKGMSVNCSLFSTLNLSFSHDRVRDIPKDIMKPEWLCFCLYFCLRGRGGRPLKVLKPIKLLLVPNALLILFHEYHGGKGRFWVCTDLFNLSLSLMMDTGQHKARNSKTEMSATGSATCGLLEQLTETKTAFKTFIEEETNFVMDTTMVE
jgi:hypothetical protein